MKRKLLLIVCFVCLLFFNCDKRSNIILGEKYRELGRDESIIFSKNFANWDNIGCEYIIEENIVYVKHLFGNIPFEIINNKLLFNSSKGRYYAIFKDEDFKDEYKDVFIGIWDCETANDWGIWEFLSNGIHNRYDYHSDSTDLKFSASSSILRIFLSGSGEEVLTEYYYFLQDDKIILKRYEGNDITLEKLDVLYK